jgi:hypothetical protein
MKTQNQIKRTLSQASNIEYVASLLISNEFLNRNELAKQVCEQFEFFNPKGQEQLSGCLKALRQLEAVGHFNLPATRRGRAGVSSPRRLDQPVALPEAVPAKAGAVRDLKLVVVRTPEQMRIWNELMIEGHPQGAGPLVGRQLRYLIGSQHGWLGGFGFAAAALNLADRDAWIGWDAAQRGLHLHRVVGMSRFLLRPSVQCHNLASKVLSMSLAALPDDFEQRYGYRPWLVESFVDTAHHAGTSYQASNWTQVGQTQGRGRQDRLKQYALSKKAIYVYPLVDDFRGRLGLSVNAGLGALGEAEGLDASTWAEYEFGGASLGDARLSRRLVQVAGAKANVPDRAFGGVAKGDWPAVKAYYRFIDHPDEEAINMANILAPHRQRTIRRMQGQQTVLCVQDGCDLTYTNLDQCEGLDEIVTNQTGAKRRGLHLHSTLTLAPNGLPLGILDAQFVTPQTRSDDDTRRSRDIPIEEKKTFVWIDHHRKLVELAPTMPQTQLVNVCDREADFFELFDEHRKKPCVDLLIRAQFDRRMKDETASLFDTVRQAPVLSQVQVSVPRKSARPKKSKQKASPKQPARVADLAIRSKRIKLEPPRGFDSHDAIEIWVIHAQEINPAENVKPVEWIVLTTMDCSLAADAEQCLSWYCLRWRIEDWHRVMKSGCKIEKLGHETAERLKRAISINMVIAWRIMLMTLMGREYPELPAEVMFSDIEVRTLQAYAKKKEMMSPELLGDAVKLVAKIGGYIGRKKDPPPGHQLLWQGYREFQFMCMGFELLDNG